MPRFADPIRRALRIGPDGSLARLRSRVGPVRRRRIEWELQILERLHSGGVCVPRAVARSPMGMAMQLIEHEGAPATRSRELFVQALQGVERMLALECVHGDLSEHNMLYSDGRVVFIDFPQAVDPRFNPRSCEIFVRDTENLCRYFATLGVHADAATLSIEMWERYLRGEL